MIPVQHRRWAGGAVMMVVVVVVVMMVVASCLGDLVKTLSTGKVI